MNFHDPSRPRLGNGLPAFLTAPQTALPRVSLTPLPNAKWRLEIIVNSSYRTLVIPTSWLISTLTDWENSPEAFIIERFNTTPTGASKDSLFETTVEIDLEEFGI